MHPQPCVKSLIRFINEKWAEEWVAKEFKASCEFRYVFIRTICGHSREGSEFAAIRVEIRVLHS